MSDLLTQVLAGCFAAGFLIVIVFNRRPVLAALIVPVVAFAWLIARNWTDAWEDGAMEAMIYGGVASCGLIASAVGAGLARFIRLRAGLSGIAAGEPADRR